MEAGADSSVDNTTRQSAPSYYCRCFEFPSMQMFCTRGLWLDLRAWRTEKEATCSQIHIMTLQIQEVASQVKQIRVSFLNRQEGLAADSCGAQIIDRPLP